MPWNMQVKDTNHSHSREKPVWISLWRRIWTQLEAWILTSQGLPCLPAFDKSPEAARKLGQELHAGLLQMVPKLFQALLSCPRLSGSLVPHSWMLILGGFIYMIWSPLSCFMFLLPYPLHSFDLCISSSPSFPAMTSCGMQMLLLAGWSTGKNLIDCLMLKKQLTNHPMNIWIGTNWRKVG